MFTIQLVCAIFAFLFGIAIGSFLNVCIYRIPHGISTAKGRSFCPSCGKQLKSRDLVPILSYLFLRGRCRFCGSPISRQYPMVEFLCGVLFLTAYFIFGFQLASIVMSLFFAILLVIAFIDYKTGLIYDRTIVCILLLTPFHVLTTPNTSLIEHFLGAVIVSVPMFLLAYLFGGFGGGDIKLTAAAGLFLGWKLMLSAIFIAVISCGFLGIFLLLTKRATRKTEIPFGPFLSVGMLLSAAFGSQFIAWYTALLAL